MQGKVTEEKAGEVKQGVLLLGTLQKRRELVTRSSSGVRGAFDWAAGSLWRWKYLVGARRQELVWVSGSLAVYSLHQLIYPLYVIL